MSLNPNSKTFRPKAVQRQSPRSLAIGTANAFRLSVDPNSQNVHGAAAAFVLYGLTRGYPSLNAPGTYLSLVVLLKAAMQSQMNRLKVAPRIWWQLVNALTPKNIIVKGQDIRYDWNMANFSVNNVPSLGGVILGPVLTQSTQGLYNVDVSAYPIPSVDEAADTVANLFSIFDTGHPLISPVDDYKYDVGCFAYKSPVSNPNLVDTFGSSYGVNASEAPLLSWFAYCGFAKSTGEAISLRIPRYFTGTQGSALQYIGLRLHYPVLMNKKYNFTRINFRSIDVMSVIDKHTQMLIDVKQKIFDSARPQVTLPPTNQLPDAYYGYQGEQPIGPIADVNLALLHRLHNFICAFSTLSATWGGTVANGLSAIATGTNLILPDMQSSFSESAWVVEAMSQLHPVYNPRNNMIHVPVPTISDDYVIFFRQAFSGTYSQTAPPPNYGGMNLDLLNSQIGGQVVCLISGPTLYEDRQAIMTMDAEYDAQISLMACAPRISPLRSGNMARTRMLNGSFLLKEDGLKRFLEYKKVEKTVMRKILDRYLEKKNVKAPSRTSPILEGLPVLGDTSAIVQKSDVPDDFLCVPVALYDSSPEALVYQRLISEDTDAKHIPNSVSQIYGVQQVGIASMYSSDPNNDTKSDVMTVSRSDVTPDEIIAVLDPLVDLLPPRAKAVAKVGQKIVKAIAPPIQNLVKKGRARRAARKKDKN